MAPKIYLVVRGDLSPAQQAVQSAHALTEFIFNHMSIAQDWYASSKTLVLLSVPDREGLERLYRKALDRGFKVAPFFEPDIGHELTAIALEPSTRNFLRSVPLAMQS
jgi:peptidyl-tRNA hydrolase